MSIRNDILRRILIAEGGPDVETTRNDYLDHIGLVLGFDISALPTRNDKLQAILQAYITPFPVQGDFDNEFSSEFI